MNKLGKIGIITGSGVEAALTAETGNSATTEKKTVETPFGPTSSPITLTKFGESEVAILQRHGEGHVLNPSEVPYRANIFAMKQLGVTHIISTGATGSLKEEIKPGDLVLIDQTIDKTYRRANTFFDDAAVHVELSQPFCPVMRKWLLDVKKQSESNGFADSLDVIKVHESGTYVVMEGPGFSTRAESLMHQSWGADLIGMTCMPEAKLAREAEIAYAMVALPTDYDCWKPHDAESPDELLKEIIGNLEKATKNAIALIKSALQDLTVLEEHASPAHDALKFAIWSDKSRIKQESIEKLKPIWGRYFS